MATAAVRRLLLEPGRRRGRRAQRRVLGPDHPGPPRPTKARGARGRGGAAPGTRGAAPGGSLLLRRRGPVSRHCRQYGSPLYNIIGIFTGAFLLTMVNTYPGRAVAAAAAASVGKAEGLPTKAWPRASLSLSADSHLTVLNNRCDRM